MIDNFSIFLTHALMLLAAWRLLRRPELDRESQDGTRVVFTRSGRKPDGSRSGA